MVENIQQVFLDSLNPLKEVRQKSETTLKSLESDSAFIFSLPEIFCKGENQVVARIAALYYKNTLVKNWCGYPENCKALVVSGVMENMVAYPQYYEGYKEILAKILEEESTEKIQPILKNIVEYINTPSGLGQNVSNRKITVALAVIQQFITRDRSKYKSADEIEAVFDSIGRKIMELWLDAYNSRIFPIFESIMEIVYTSHDNFYVLPFLLNLEIYVFCKNMAQRILMDEPTNENQNSRKLAALFLYRTTNKGVKRFYKVDEICDHHTLPVVKETYEVLKKVVELKADIEPTLEAALDLFSFLVTEKNLNPIIEPDYLPIIFNTILPTHIFSKKDKEDFQEEPETYIKVKYSYYCINIKNTTNILFSEIMENISDEMFSVIYNHLLRILEEFTGDEDGASRVYASLFLITSISKKIVSLRKETLPVLMHFLVKNLHGKFLFLVSQSLYTLQFFNIKHLQRDLASPAFSRVLELLNSESEALRVDAALTVIFFLNLKEQLVSNIPLIVHSLIAYGSKYDLETCNDALESIIETYPSEISVFAPELVATLSKNILENIGDDDNFDKMGLICGYIRTINDMVVILSNQQEILWKTFFSCAEVIYNVFGYKRLDYYLETVTLVSDFLYGFKAVDKNFVNLLEIVLQMIPDEISSVSDEISILLDNYLSYGKGVITTEHMDGIFKIFEVLATQEDDFVFEEDFVSACRLVESTFFYQREYLVGRAHPIYEVVVRGYKKLDKEGVNVVHALEAMMCLLTVEPSIFFQDSFTPSFVEELKVHKKKFSRVHDKKLSLLFCGELFKIETKIGSLSAPLAAFFSAQLLTLPKAIKTRNDKKEKDDEEDEEYDELTEDIYFETPLDHFEPVQYIQDLFMKVNINSIGAEIMESMPEKVKEDIRKMMGEEIPVQKT